MKRTTTWRPDTCNCVIEYEWDDAESESTRTHTLKTITPCADHPGASAQVGRVMETQVVHPHQHNKRKNDVISAALQNFSELRDVAADGSYTLKNGINITWRWTGTDDGRVLYITIPNLTQAKKNQLQTAVDNRLGTGKVIIE